MAMLLRRAQLSSWLSCRCSLDLVAAVAAGDRSGLLSFLKRRGGGAANSFWNDEERREKEESLDFCWQMIPHQGHRRTCRQQTFSLSRKFLRRVTKLLDYTQSFSPGRYKPNLRQGTTVVEPEITDFLIYFNVKMKPSCYGQIYLLSLQPVWTWNWDTLLHRMWRIQTCQRWTFYKMTIIICIK